MVTVEGPLARSSPGQLGRPSTGWPSRNGCSPVISKRYRLPGSPLAAATTRPSHSRGGSWSPPFISSMPPTRRAARVASRSVARLTSPRGSSGSRRALV